MMRALCMLWLAFAGGSLAQAGWVDEWINQHAVTEGGYFEGQKRGYFTGGGFSARWRVPNEPLVTFSAPKMRGGCGGIDLFLGGMSFVNADYLVQKFQRLIQMAPAVGFEIALKTLNKELADTMGKINATVDALNGMQMKECAFHNQVVATVERDDPKVMGSILTAVSSEYNLGEQLKTIWYENEEANNANNGEPDTDLKQSISECPSEFRAIFSGGSVIGNAAAQIGMADELDRQMFGFGWSVAIAAAIFMTLAVLAIVRAAKGHPLAAAIPSGVMALGAFAMWCLLPDFAYTLPGSFAAFIIATRFALYDIPGVKEAHERADPDMEENQRTLNLIHGNDVVPGPCPTQKPTHEYDYRTPPGYTHGCTSTTARHLPRAPPEDTDFPPALFLQA